MSSSSSSAASDASRSALFGPSAAARNAGKANPYADKPGASAAPPAAAAAAAAAAGRGASHASHSAREPSFSFSHSAQTHAILRSLSD